MSWTGKNEKEFGDRIRREEHRSQEKQHVMKCSSRTSVKHAQGAGSYLGAEISDKSGRVQGDKIAEVG